VNYLPFRLPLHLSPKATARIRPGDLRAHHVIGHSGISAPTAALIGAGVAAVVGLIAQYLAHRLSLRRERAAHRRERLSRVIEEAALALHRAPEDGDRPPGPPGSLAGTAPALVPLFERASRGFALLQIHFGMTHPLIEQYRDTLVAVAEAERLQQEALLRRDTSPAAIEPVARAIAEASIARETWTQSARYFVDYDLQPRHSRSQRRIRRHMHKRLWTRPDSHSKD
jgi:hypothetical protein